MTAHRQLRAYPDALAGDPLRELGRIVRYCDDKLRVEHARPFDMLLDPGVQADATAWSGGETPTAHEAQNPAKMMDQAKV